MQADKSSLEVHKRVRPLQIIAPVLMVGSRFGESGDKMIVLSGRRRPAVHRQIGVHTDMNMCSVLTNAKSGETCWKTQ